MTAKSKAEIAAEKRLADTTYEEDINNPPSAPDPVSPPVEPGPPVETMDKLGIGPRDPYPTGNPPQMTHAEINGLVSPSGAVSPAEPVV